MNYDKLTAETLLVNPCPFKCPGCDFTSCTGCDERKAYDEQMKSLKQMNLLDYYNKLIEKKNIQNQIYDLVQQLNDVGLELLKFKV